MTDKKTTAGLSMTNEYVFEAREIARRIAEARDAIPDMTNQDIADAMGVTINAVKKLMGGDATKGFAKLKRLANLLHKTPNELLGVSETDRSNEIWAVVEETLQALRMPSDQAAVLVQTLREVAGTPLAGSAIQDPTHSRRILAADAVRKFLHSKQ